MSFPRRLRRSAQLMAIACALLVPGASAAATPATGPRAQQGSDSSRATAGAARAAVAEERYYSSYGEPEPLIPTQSSVPTSETPWVPVTLSIVGVLAIVALSATQMARVRVRRRRAAHTAA